MVLIYDVGYFTRDDIYHCITIKCRNFRQVVDIVERMPNFSRVAIINLRD